MIELISSKKRKANKPHICDYCRETIQVGEDYQIDTLKCDEIYTWKAHLKCIEITSDLWGYADPDEYGMDSDLFIETVSDFCRIFVCPDCEKYSVEEECDEWPINCIDKVYAFLQKHDLVSTRDKYGRRCWKCVQKEEQK